MTQTKSPSRPRLDKRRVVCLTLRQGERVKIGDSLVIVQHARSGGGRARLVIIADEETHVQRHPALTPDEEGFLAEREREAAALPEEPAAE